jgi:hypothetical protein
MYSPHSYLEGLVRCFFLNMHWLRIEFTTDVLAFLRRVRMKPVRVLIHIKLVASNMSAEIHTATEKAWPKGWQHSTGMQ